MMFEYLKERLGVETLQDQSGFVCFKIESEECFIQELYVRPEMRRIGAASLLIKDVCRLAKERGCKIVSCSVNAQANGATEAMKVVLSCGGTLALVSGQNIYFKKEL